MKTIQIEAHQEIGSLPRNNELLKSGGVKRIHNGWYTVTYNGVNCDCSTVVSAKRNKNGQIAHKSNQDKYADYDGR